LGRNRLREDPRQEAFCQAYLTNGGQATRAAIEAGYSVRSAPGQGSKLLHRKDVQERIEQMRSSIRYDHSVTVARVLKEYARLGYFDLRRLFDPEGHLLPVREWDDDSAACIASVDVHQVPGKPDRIVRIRAGDKKGALDAMARTLGMFKDSVSLDLNPLREIMTIVSGAGAGLIREPEAQRALPAPVEPAGD
jgi:phage terminase small subunit